MTDAFTITHPHLTLIDGIIACAGDGVEKVSTIPLGCAIGSRSTILADVVASEIAGH